MISDTQKSAAGSKAASDGALAAAAAALGSRALSRGSMYWLPVLHQPANDCSPLIAPLLRADPLHKELLHDVLDSLRDSLALPLTAELLALLEASCAALSAVDQDLAAEVARQAGLTSTIVVPLLRRACSADSDTELRDRIIELVGVLAASLASHGEHTMRIGVGSLPPLSLLCQPNGRQTGTRLWPAARLAIGALAAGWAGLSVKGQDVLECVLMRASPA